jgi:hypothetical protein
MLRMLIDHFLIGVNIDVLGPFRDPALAAPGPSCPKLSAARWFDSTKR